MNRCAAGIILLAALALPGCCLGQAAVSPSSQRDAAFALEQQHRFPEAESLWNQIVQAHPGDAEAYAHLGYLESQQEHPAQAVADYRRAVALNPSMPGLQMNFGLALFKSGDLKESAHVLLGQYRSAAPNSPEAQRLRILIGTADYGSQQYAAAVPFLRDAMARDPQNLPYRLVLAHACLWSKQYACVLDVYHQILSLNAESAEADMLAGEAYDEMRDHQDAIEQFRNAVKADPNLPGVHFGLGYLLWCQSQFEEAAQQFQMESQNTPGDAEAMAYWADSAVRLNHPDIARPLVEKALRMSSRQELPWLDLGILDATAGSNQAALHDFEQAERIAPSDVQVHWRLARLYQAMGRHAEAQAEFEKTKTLTRAADQTVREKLEANRLHQASDKNPQASSDKSTE
ncbi:MAG: tetratricopeptide repeat protein [Acidobacteriaceae bacterium]